MYPALAVLQAAQQLNKTGLEVLWIGAEGGMEEELVRRSNIPYQSIPAAGLHGVGWRALPGNLNRLRKGFSASMRILAGFRPHLNLYTGGYLAAPIALASWMQGKNRPAQLVFVPDVEPPMSLYYLGNFADRIAVSVDESHRFFKNSEKVITTGYPTRQALDHWTRPQALSLLGLDQDLPVLLVLGGSKGARSLNRALTANLPELLKICQVIHVTGNLDWPEIQVSRENLDRDFSRRYHVFPYLHDEMGAALRSADLVISRAGASILGEFPLFGLPAILVPYPHAWRYQKVNAQYLASRDAAIIIQDHELFERILPMVATLLSNPDQLARMRLAMISCAMQDPANRIACLMFDLVDAKSRGE